MDLVSFRSGRALRRAEPSQSHTLALEDRFGDQGMSRLIPGLRAIDPRPRRGYDPRNEAQRQSQSYLFTADAVLSATLDAMYLHALLAPQPAGTAPRTVALAVLVTLDRLLTAQENQPSPQVFEKDVKDALAIEGLTLGDQKWFAATFGRLWGDLVDSLIANLLTGSDPREVARLTRLLLILGLLLDRMVAGQFFSSAHDILLRLRYRNPLLPPDIVDRFAAGRSTKLVRAATVSDLYVVRSEWRCFVPGEVCEVRNVMSHESLEVRTVHVDERQTVTDRNEQISSSQQDESRSATKSDMSEQTQRQMALALQANAQVNVSGQYGSAKIEASAGLGVNFSLQDNNSRATQLSREVVARSVSTVETNVRTERRDTTLTRFKQSFQHGFKNDTAVNATGIYRWVDRIDRYQVFRYPDRLQLEFQLPEPGRYLRQRLLAANVSLAVDKPPAFTITPDSFTAESYSTLAGTFRAAGIEPPPQSELAVSAAINAVAAAPQPNDGTQRYTVPAAGEKAELVLPPGYIAKSLTITGKAMPVLANWNRESDVSTNIYPLGGFHTIVISAQGGGQSFSESKVGKTGAVNSVQDSGDSTKLVQYVDAVCDFSFVAYILPPLTQKIPVALHAAGAESVTATVEVLCVPSEETMRTWRLSAFNACLASWQTWNSDYQSARAQTGMSNNPLAERSPARNAEMILDEIKRQVMAWLLAESPLKGRPALLGDTIDTDLDAALEVAPDIQFLEQAFEWINVSYVPYPYYWAKRRGNPPDSAWDDLITLETADANLGRFLRSGSVRVVVPVRPGFTEAVAYYLLFGKPWQGGPPPLPGDIDYLSVAAEIRDMMVPPEDGEALDSWETRLPTTFQWLDSSPDLPHNTAGTLGAGPNQPHKVLCPDS